MTANPCGSYSCISAQSQLWSVEYGMTISPRILSNRLSSAPKARSKLKFQIKQAPQNPRPDRETITVM